MISLMLSRGRSGEVVAGEVTAKWPEISKSKPRVRKTACFLNFSKGPSFISYFDEIK